MGHKHPAGQVDHRDSPRWVVIESHPPSRYPRWKIGWAQNPRFFIEIIIYFFFIPDMVATGDHIGAHIQEFLGDGSRQTEATRGVLAVDDDKIDLTLPF